MRIILAMAVASLSFAILASGADAATAPREAAVPEHLSGVHGFDFQFGRWTVRHRVKRASGDQWLEFDGTCSDSPIMDGAANIEDNTFNKPDGVTHGVGLRAYDPKTAQWAIWWVDGRDPFGALDPPVKGRFENGVGAFYSDSMIEGKPVRTRFIWSNITLSSAHWEQAFSSDSGKTWVTNWTMEFRRVS